MPRFIEKDDKLNLNVSASDNFVKITVNRYNGTDVDIAAKYEDRSRKKIPDNSGSYTIELGKAIELKGQKIKFTGSAENPGGDSNRITHTIFEDGGNSISYTFSEDYTGTPDYDGSAHPTYIFIVNFI